MEKNPYNPITAPSSFSEEEMLAMAKELSEMDKPAIISNELFNKIQIVAAYQLNKFNKSQGKIE